MTTKTLQYDDYRIDVASPTSSSFENGFYEKIYTILYEKIDDKCEPQINFDDFYDNSAGIDIKSLAEEFNIKIERTANTEEKFKQKAILAFLLKFPLFFCCMQNLNANAEVEIASIENLIGEKVNAENFIQIKKILDNLNSKRWTREKNVSERQSGVSTLGTISESLLEKALSDCIEANVFFKNTTSAVQSYGDFVLMCLPNNLWLSVKSNFARERLLASGFSTDILGVGFFTDSKEFTSGSKIRNFQKVGFIGMYVPDIPITDEQKENDSSTFHEVESYYAVKGEDVPKNINGKPFIRRLSSLKDDLNVLLSEPEMKKRTTIGF